MSKVYGQIDFCMPAGPVPIASGVRAFLIITKGEVQDRSVFREREREREKQAEMILLKERFFHVRAAAATSCRLDLRFA
jgi:hypothetical protein